MRSYGQYCGLAKALDIVGDRWTLLIVRELLVGDSRYSDLLAGLPGIATNLLAARLVDMEQAGLIEKTALPPPASTTVFRLTERGQQLRGVIRALGQWAGPLMTGRGKGETVRTRWMVLPAEFYLRDRRPSGPPVTIQIHGEDESIVLESRQGIIRARAGVAADADLTLTGSPELALGIMMRRLSVTQARSKGLRIDGDTSVLKRLQRPD